MSKIIETSFGVKIDPLRIASGSVSQVKKSGPFFVFSVRLSAEDIREYSFTNKEKALSMRHVFIGHLEQKIISDARKKIA